MLSHLPIGTRLGIAFGSQVVLLVAAVLAGLFGLAALQDSAQILRQQATLTHNAAQVRRLALEQRRFEKDVFINLTDGAKIADYRQRWDAVRQQLDATLDEGTRLSDEAELQALYAEARQALEGYAGGFVEVYGAIQAARLTTTLEANAAMGRHKDAVYRLDSSAAAIDSAAVERLEAAEREADRQARRARLGLIGFAVLAVIAAAVLALNITRSISRPLREALVATRRLAEGDLRQPPCSTRRDETGQLLNAMGEACTQLGRLVDGLHASSDDVLQRADEVLLGSRELAARTEEQVAALQQTAASMEQVSVTSRQTSDATEQANRLAASAVQTAQSGGRDVAENIQLMRELADSSQRIQEIVRVIDSIAFQTNILALNASVEAARAGEQGRGFAVVASEVRSLATRSATSAREIRELIEEIGTRIDQGARQAEHSGQTIGETVESIRQLASLMAEIAAASHEQRSGFAQINDAIVQLDGTTQRNATLVEQSRNAATALDEQARRMQQQVAAFRTEGRDA